MTRIKIRTIKLADIDYIYSIGIKEDGFAVSQTSRFWDKEVLYPWVKSKTDVLLAAEDSGRVVGYVLTQVHKPTGSAIITDIYVDENWRGKGIGSRLLKECLKQLKKGKIRYTYAQIKPENKASTKLFISAGFNKGYNFVWTEKSEK